MSGQKVIRIALTGKLRSGKDSSADHLVEHYGFTRLAFGDALKDSYHSLFPWIPREPKPRAEYQSFGQAMRASRGENVWVDEVAWKVAESGGNIVITDLRQPNEYEWCRENGFVIIRVTAPEELRLERARQAGDHFDKADLAHDTERHVDTFAVDYEIVNDGTLAELKAEVDGLITNIKERKFDG